MVQVAQEGRSRTCFWARRMEGKCCWTWWNRGRSRLERRRICWAGLRLAPGTSIRCWGCQFRSCRKILWRCGVQKEANQTNRKLLRSKRWWQMVKVRSELRLCQLAPTLVVGSALWLRLPLARRLANHRSLNLRQHHNQMEQFLTLKTIARPLKAK